MSLHGEIEFLKTLGNSFPNAEESATITLWATKFDIENGKIKPDSSNGWWLSNKPFRRGMYKVVLPLAEVLDVDQGLYLVRSGAHLLSCTQPDIIQPDIILK